VGQRPGVVGQAPPHRSGQVARLGLQDLQLLALGRAQRPVGLLGQRLVVAGVTALDLVGVPRPETLLVPV